MSRSQKSDGLQRTISTISQAPLVTDDIFQPTTPDTPFAQQVGLSHDLLLIKIDTLIIRKAARAIHVWVHWYLANQLVEDDTPTVVVENYGGWFLILNDDLKFVDGYSY